MTQQSRTIAVLTGDLVNSTGLGPAKVERAFRALEDCAALQADWAGGRSLHFTRHRGDGWQVALPEPKYALRAALCFRAALRAEGEDFDSYIGLAEGEAPEDIGPDLNEETEEVFVASGDALDMIKLLSLGERLQHASGGALQATTLLADYISQGWTPPQASAILPFLSPGTPPHYTEIAKALGKSRQSVTKSLEAAGYQVLRDALKTLEAADTPADPEAEHG